MNHVIGIGGFYQSGKDVVADYLVAQHGFVKLGMSDVLNDFVAAIDPILFHTHYYVRYSEFVAQHGYVEAKKNSEVRRLLQATGTEAGRKILGEDVWVNGARARIEAARQSSHVVITGIRFPNEIRMIQELWGLTLYIVRPGFEGDGHASENSVKPEDFERIITNDGTIADLHGLVDEIVELESSEI
jgi:hypothetical protein